MMLLTRVVYGLLILFLCIGFTCYLFGLVLLMPILLFIKAAARISASPVSIVVIYKILHSHFSEIHSDLLS